MKSRHTIISVIVLIASGLLISSIFLSRQFFLGEHGIIYFSIVNFLGYLFFLLMPVEVLFAYNLDSFNPIFLILVALLSGLIAQSIDYGIGRYFSDKFINDIIGKKKYDKTKKILNKYGGWVIFTFNLLPLSSPIIALVAGMLKFNFRRMILYMGAGLLIKYSLIVLFLS